MTNSYVTLSAFRHYLTSPGMTLREDEIDDDVIEGMLEIASRRTDGLTGWWYYPLVETRKFDVPDSVTLYLESPLLEVTTLTNGDDTTISSTDYYLNPANTYPKFEIQIKPSSTIEWECDSDDNKYQVIDVLGYWGMHRDYARRAWKSAGTLGAAISDTTGLSITMTAGHTLDTRGGEIIKIDNEIFNTVGIPSTTLTVEARGDNGSTAATHTNGATVYLWQPPRDIVQLTLEIASVMYRSRYGDNADNIATYTTSGVIVTPRSLPVWAQEIIYNYQRCA